MYVSFIVFKRLIIVHNVIKFQEFVITPSRQIFATFSIYSTVNLQIWVGTNKSF